VRLAEDALPLLDATRATAGEFPGCARGRLQTKVRQTLGRPETSASSASDEEGDLAQPGLLALPELAPGLPARGEERRMMWRWRWLLGLATAATAVALVMVLWHAPTPVIQVAMLNTAGVSRGSDAKELALMQQAWNKAPVDSFSNAEDARAWETNWPGAGRRAVVKILYDRPAGELRVLGRWKGKPFAKTFIVEQDFAAALSLARDFIREQTSR